MQTNSSASKTNAHPSTKAAPTLSKILSTLSPRTRVEVRGGLATIGGIQLAEHDAIKLAALNSFCPLSAEAVADLLLTGVYHRLVVHSRVVMHTPTGPVMGHTLGLRDTQGNSMPLRRLWQEVQAVHEERMKKHATKAPVRILDVGGRLVAQLAGGKRFPVSRLLCNRVAIGGTYPAYIHTFQANGRAMHVAVPLIEQEVHVTLAERVRLSPSLASQVKSRAQELHFQDQLNTLSEGGKIELGNFALA